MITQITKSANVDDDITYPGNIPNLLLEIIMHQRILRQDLDIVNSARRLYSSRPFAVSVVIYMSVFGKKERRSLSYIVR